MYTLTPSIPFHLNLNLLKLYSFYWVCAFVFLLLLPLFSLIQTDCAHRGIFYAETIIDVFIDYCFSEVLYANKCLTLPLTKTNIRCCYIPKFLDDLDLLKYFFLHLGCDMIQGISSAKWPEMSSMINPMNRI